MLVKRLVQCSIWIALLLLLVTAHSVSAFDPPPLPWGLPTVMSWPTAHPLALGESWSPAPTVVTPTPTATPTPRIVAPAVKSFPTLPRAPTPIKSIPAQVAPQPPVIYVTPLPTPLPPPLTMPSIPSVAGGSNPMDALEPSDTWLHLDSGASVWYRVGTDGAQMSVFLDLDPASNVAMSIYAPGQLDRPIGKGTPNGQDLSRLIWSGGHWSAQGDWYAQVINYNPMAVQYRLMSSARDTRNKSCHGYWEKINGAPVYWTICE